MSGFVAYLISSIDMMALGLSLFVFGVLSIVAAKSSGLISFLRFQEAIHKKRSGEKERDIYISEYIHGFRRKMPIYGLMLAILGIFLMLFSFFI